MNTLDLTIEVEPVGLNHSAVKEALLNDLPLFDDPTMLALNYHIVDFLDKQTPDTFSGLPEVRARYAERLIEILGDVREDVLPKDLVAGSQQLIHARGNGAHNPDRDALDGIGEVVTNFLFSLRHPSSCVLEKD